jgi:hypothetical protein
MILFGCDDYWALMWIDEVLICPCLNADKALKQTQLPVDTWPANDNRKQNHAKKTMLKNWCFRLYQLFWKDGFQSMDNKIINFIKRG